MDPQSPAEANESAESLLEFQQLLAGLSSGTGLEPMFLLQAIKAGWDVNVVQRMSSHQSGHRSNFISVD